MADFSALKQSIQNYIKQNGNKEITGAILQNILLSMVTTMGDGAINGNASDITDLNRGLSDEKNRAEGAETTTILFSDGKLVFKNAAGTVLYQLSVDSFLSAITTRLNTGALYAGYATPSTTPAALTSQEVFYLATQAGTYTNFHFNGGDDPIVLTKDGIYFIVSGDDDDDWNAEPMLQLDDVPTASSNNAVKSGGVAEELALGAVYDVSAKNPTAGPNNDGKFESLSALFSDANLSTLIPASVRKGGMSIKFVQSSDNKYVQYRLMVTEWSVDTENWAIADEGVYVENPEFVYVKTDAKGKILWAINTDGGIYYGAGVPQQVIDYINEKIAELSLDEYEDMVAFLNDLEKGDKTLQALLDEKVNKEEGKSLIDAEYANGVHYVENSEFIRVYLDEKERILWGIQNDGNIFYGGLPSQIIEFINKIEKDLLNILSSKVDKIENKSLIDSNFAGGISYKEDKEYISVITDNKGRILIGFKKDGDVFYGPGIPSQIKEYINSLLVNINTDFSSNSSKIIIGGNEYIEKDSLGALLHSNWGMRPYLSNLIPILLDANLDIVRGCPPLIEDNTDPNNIVYNKDPNVCNYIEAGGTWLGTDFVVDLCSDSTIRTLIERWVGTYDNIIYWQYLNEMNSRWTGETGQYSTAELFRCYKTCYKETKRVNPNAIVVFGPAAHDGNGCIGALANYIDPNEPDWRFWDSFDIYAINHYTLGTIEDELKNLYNIMKFVYNPERENNFIDKPLWITEFNNPSYDAGDIQQANVVPEIYIKFLAYGVDKCIVYRMLDDATFDSRKIDDQREAFFGILRKNVTGSYVSLLKNDGEYNTAISVGSDLKRVYFDTSDIAYLSLKNTYSRTIVSELQNNGLVISGSGYTLTGITLKKSDDSETSIWSGSVVISDSNDKLILNSSYFTNVAEGDTLLFAVEDILDDSSHTWIDMDPREVYYSLKFMSKILPVGVKKPNISKISNSIFRADWKLKNGNNVSAIWNEGNSISVKIDVDDYALFLNYKGEILNIDKNNFVVSREIIYIINFNNLKIKVL